MKRTSRLLSTAAAALLSLSAAWPSPSSAADKPVNEKAQIVNPSDESILKGLKAPAGFDISVFAKPPAVSYPTCLSAMPTGELFVGIDANGSLDTKPGRGKIVRCVDSNHAGKADQITTFATLDSPRGLFWDGVGRKGVLYVLHPPLLEAYYDDTGEGVATRHEILVKDIGRDLKYRGADHTTNGIRLGIDGWIYIAMGDYGTKTATGKDGTVCEFKGGGVVRVRADGTGLERYSAGQRNIYDVAIDPLMNVYTRDNTNDGDAWNDRLSYIVPTGQYGYPSLFINFPEEIVPCMIDLGDGSPCGSLFVDEPAALGPELGHGLYTVEWGTGAIFRHPLNPSGAGFTTGKQDKWFAFPRGTDLDIDGEGHFFASSWINAEFNYAGPNVGYVLRMSKQNAKPAAFPDLASADDLKLVSYHGAGSAVLRQNAQRALLRRPINPAAVQSLEALAASAGAPLECRVAAIFTLEQWLGGKANDALVRLAKQGDVREFALRALSDRKGDANAPAGPFVDGLNDANPRVRLQAVVGLARLGRPEAAAAILPRLADSDSLVSHVAINALVTLRAGDLCLTALDGSSPEMIVPALRVLQGLHDVRVVDGLIDRLARTQDPARRGMILKTLCRLCNTEAEWDGKSWWGTRPDTSGPYYKAADWEATPKVKAALAAALGSEKTDVLRGFALQLQRHKIDLPEFGAVMTKLAAIDPAFSADMVALLSTGKAQPTDSQMALLRTVAASDRETPATRAKALKVLVKNSSRPAAFDGAMEVLGGLSASGELDKDANKELAAAWAEFTRDPKHDKRLKQFEKLADAGSPRQRELAFAVLLSMADSKLAPREDKAAAAKAVDAAWDAGAANPQTLAALLRAVGRMKADRYAAKVGPLLKDSRADVSAAADFAAAKLGVGSSVAGGNGGKPLIDSLEYEKVVAEATKTKGDAKRGAELFVKQGCIVCHTISADEAPKGPLLAGISTRYSRAELCESILKPNAKIAQGFETQLFKLKNKEEIEGFVSREAGDEVEVRIATGSATVIKKADIAKRVKRDNSIMPEGLVSNLTTEDLASILAYLESLKGK